MKTLSKIALALLFAGVFSYLFYKHSGFWTYSHNPMQYMPNMHRTKALIPERGYAFFEDGSAARVPPTGTVARNIRLYNHTREENASTIEKYSNPLPLSRHVVLRGQKMFMTYCVVCHGPKGDGNGYVVPPFPKPPSLQSDKIRNYADSQIFHVATVGQNVMYPYGTVIRENDRWAIIHYIRVLQRAENPSPEDVAAFEKILEKSPEGTKP